ncbi:LuxR C-terminal-related transcriptional regulator [Nocardioides sp.]|uniref:LuxR C-terminal-related transcriptional regulator n=1 Tax=Nocardioides sp. TaxID=35761 RepID=UPI002ED5039B
MSAPVLATKLFAPPPRPQLVARQRLLERLDTTLDEHHRLTLVSAPAGFGKTTVLGDWLRHLGRTQDTVRVAWVSLDDGDNDPPRFLTHVVAALQGAGLDGVDAVLDSPGAPPGVIDLTALVNRVSEASERAPETRWVLVLDDLHVIQALEVQEASAFLLEHLPARVHLVLATRSDPPLPLARLRSSGQLTELRAAELRFTRSEAREFLNSVMGLDLTSDDVEALDERTEGWAAGLQLAALSLRGVEEREEVVGFIDAFTGSSRFVIDYLADEVLARQPDEVREFLLHTAVLDRLTGSLCDGVTDRTGGAGARMLEDLERSNLFVVALDADRAWYRYHHLFADVLHARLLAEQPELVPSLHQRASGWYAERGLVLDAVRHSLAAEDFDRARQLMEEALPEVRRARQDSVLLSWAAALPEPVVRRSPALCIVAAWSKLMTGDLDAVEPWLEDAEAALAAGAEDPDLASTWADTEDLRMAPAMIPVYRASVAQARGDVAGTVRHARQAVELAGPDDHFIHGAGAGFLGLAAFAAGDVPEAITTFSMAVRHLHAAGNLVDELDSTVVLADMWLASGRPSRARSLFESALRTATGGREPYPRATADLHVGLAELDSELGDLPSAEAHLQRARVLAERASISENRYRWYTVMAQLQSRLGDGSAPLDLLDEAEALYRRGFYPELRPIHALRARLHLTHGDVGAAEAWTEEHGVTADDEPTYLREYEHLTLARLLLAQQRHGDALTLLDRLEAAAAAHRPGSAIEIRMLRALAEHGADRRGRALRDLERALTQSPEPEGYVRLFLDEGAPMLALLRAAVEDGVLQEHTARLLAAAGPAQPATHQQRGLPDPLSERELEVLRQLDTGLTGPEIARQLFVSLNTLRTHTKRIFTKLDVNNRAAAVRRARELGLLREQR